MVPHANFGAFFFSVNEKKRHTEIRSTVKTNLCFRYEGGTGEERVLVNFKDIPMNNHINGELSTTPFH